MKPETQLMMYLLNKQGHPIEAESINTPNMENTEVISKKRMTFLLWDFGTVHICQEKVSLNF